MSPPDQLRAIAMPLKILVVEDEPIIGLELEYLLSNAGFTVLGPAPSVAAARPLVNDAEAAVLDISLGKETSEEIAVALQERGVPYVVLTALRDGMNAGSWTKGSSAWLLKPVRAGQLITELRKLQT